MFKVDTTIKDRNVDGSVDTSISSLKSHKRVDKAINGISLLLIKPYYGVIGTSYSAHSGEIWIDLEKTEDRWRITGIEAVY